MNEEYYIHTLEMNKHPEGGYYKEMYRSNDQIPRASLPQRFNGDRNFATAIYYLLSGNDKSHLHKIDADEMWLFLAGSPMLVHYINTDNELVTMRIGKPEQGGSFFGVVPHGAWFCAEPEDKTGFSLVSCVVAPGFDFKGFILGTGDELLAEYPQHREFILKFTRE